MADQEVPDLDLAGALTGAEVFHIVQDGNSRRVPLSMITGFGGGSGGDADLVVRVATQSPGTFATDFVAGAVVDGETLILGEDILIKDQVDLSENGVYIVPASGPPTRSTYVDTSGELAGILVLVTEGSNNENSLWRCTNEEPIVVDTDDIIFARISAGGGFPVPGTDYGDIIADQFNNLLVQNSVLEVNNFMGSAFVTSDEGLLSQVDNATFATTQAIVAYVEGEISDFADTLPDVLWLGGIDCSIDPDYPEATAGQVRYASLAGTLGDRQIQYGSIIYALVDTYGGDYNDAGVDFAVLPRNPVQRVGQIDCTANPNYPPATKGQFWLVIPGGDGKIGGASGRDVAEGDWIVADSDNAGGTEASVGANWSIIHVAGGAGATAFLDLTDVDDTGLADGDVWVWDASAGMLVPVPFGGDTAFADVPAVWAESASDEAISPAVYKNARVLQAVSFASTWSPDCDAGINFSVTVGGTMLVDDLANRNSAREGLLIITMDGTGGHAVTFETSWKIKGTIDTTANAINVVRYFVRGDLTTIGEIITIPPAAAIASDVNTGTSTAKFVTPDALAGSNLGTAVITLLVSDPNGFSLTTGNGKAYYPIPAALNGMNLISVRGQLSTASSSGSVTVQIDNGGDMLSGLLTITSGNTQSTTATIDTGADDVATGDVLRIDVDTAGTGAKGLIVQMEFRLP